MKRVAGLMAFVLSITLATIVTGANQPSISRKVPKGMGINVGLPSRRMVADCPPDDINDKRGQAKR